MIEENVCVAELDVNRVSGGILPADEVGEGRPRDTDTHHRDTAILEREFRRRLIES